MVCKDAADGKSNGTIIKVEIAVTLMSRLNRKWSLFLRQKAFFPIENQSSHHPHPPPLQTATPHTFCHHQQGGRKGGGEEPVNMRPAITVAMTTGEEAHL